MADVGPKTLARGQCWPTDGTTDTDDYVPGDKFEGTLRVFKARYTGRLINDGDDTTSVDGDRTQFRDASDVVCQLVRNVATVTLPAKAAVIWASGYRNRRVNGIQMTIGGEVAGIVDEFRASNVPVGSLFWIVRKGLALWRTNRAATEGNDFSAGAWLVGGSAAASTAATTGGFACDQAYLLDASPTGSTLGGLIQNRVAKAMSANTTNQTGRDVLVDVALL